MSEDQVKEILSTIFQVKQDSIKLDQPIKEIGNWDSIKHLMMISTLEEEASTSFTDEDLINMVTPGDVLTILNRE